jgi:hypothetical protein
VFAVAESAQLLVVESGHIEVAEQNRRRRTMAAKTLEEEFEDIVEVTSLILEVDGLIENRDWELDGWIFVDKFHETRMTQASELTSARSIAYPRTGKT